MGNTRDDERPSADRHVRVVVSLLRSVDGVEDFISASREFRHWLDTQPGFVSYELIGSGRHWTDRMEWESAHAADAGDLAFAETAFPARFSALVERYMFAAGEPSDLA